MDWKTAQSSQLLKQLDADGCIGIDSRFYTLADQLVTGRSRRGSLVRVVPIASGTERNGCTCAGRLGEFEYSLDRQASERVRVDSGSSDSDEIIDEHDLSAGDCSTWRVVDGATFLNECGLWHGLWFS